MDTILQISEKKVSVAFIIMALCTFSNLLLTNKAVNAVETLATKIENSELDAMLEYPMNVIEYGLQDTTSAQDVQDQITIWVQDKWGAQIGAIETVCDNDISRLHEVMSEDLSIEVCRRVK